ncbi:unnamed protein product [Nippostrongylus brasiliensis]|uniref:Transposase n=1 Tax=Nippostrongylus brasiliensis TaxID=27835 RepID=A0A0N4YUY3_NIPBR|nr:unnamed protein product [Nippostrongylus brasiliensis]
MPVLCRARKTLGTVVKDNCSRPSSFNITLNQMLTTELFGKGHSRTADSLPPPLRTAMVVMVGEQDAIS